MKPFIFNTRISRWIGFCHGNIDFLDVCWSIVALHATDGCHEFGRLNGNGRLVRVELFPRSRCPERDDRRFGFAEILQETIVEDDWHYEDGRQENAFSAPAIIVANLEERRQIDHTPLGDGVLLVGAGASSWFVR